MHNCPGTQSELAGKSTACEGCPNQNICATQTTPQTDKDINLLKERLQKIKKIILVLSGKGGVGKSTVASQLAYAMSLNQETQVGLLDIDLCGPSTPLLLGVTNETMHSTNIGITPVYPKDNLAVCSIGFLMENKDESVVLGGTKKTQLIKQFVMDVEWDFLDCLIVDTPPGTSDEHLSIVKFLKEGKSIDGCILVTTPQQISLQDVDKELDFCRKMGLHVYGIVENMTYFECSKCKHLNRIFKQKDTNNTLDLATKWNTKVLASLPLDISIGLDSDSGKQCKSLPVLSQFKAVAKCTLIVI